MGKLYLIPTPIGETAGWDDALPGNNRTVLSGLKYFVVENVRTARRFIAKSQCGLVIDELVFSELNEHTPPEEVERLLDPIVKEGADIGLMSEAGLPCIADPGALLVAAAHRKGIEVAPLSGPSSIFLALMASGANGQSFAFNGYLPVKQPARTEAIRKYEKRARTENQSQIFIETPYRNGSLFNDLLKACAAQTNLTIAADLLEPTQLIETFTIGQWQKKGAPDFHKRPAIFILF